MGSARLGGASAPVTAVLTERGMDIMFTEE